MGKKRLLALMCAVSILLTTFMPLSALGDEGVGELVVTEALTEEVVAFSEPSAENSTEPAETTTAPTAEPNTAEPTAIPVATPTATATATNEQSQVTPEPATPTSAATRTAEPTQSAPPSDSIPNIDTANTFQILTDRKTTWLGDIVNYTAVRANGVTKNSWIIVYDPNVTDANGQPIILARTEKCPDQVGGYDLTNVPKDIKWSDIFGGLTFTYEPKNLGQFRLAWQMFAGLNDIQPYVYYDYSSNDVVKVIESPVVQSMNYEQNGRVGDLMTVTVQTNLSADSITLTDENDNALQYIEAIDKQVNFNNITWTCRYKLYKEGLNEIRVRAVSTIDYITKTSDKREFKVIMQPSLNPQPTPDASGIIPVVTPMPTSSIPTNGEVRLSNVPSANVVPGMTVTFNLDVEYAMANGTRYAYNATGSKFFDIIDYIEITPNATNANYPFDADGAKRIMLRSLDEAQKVPFRYTLRARSNLQNGTYPFEFTVRYKLKSKSEPESDKTVSGVLFVFGADDPNPTQEPSPTEKPDLGYVRFIQIPSISARAGDTVHLDMGVEFAASDGKRYSYTDADFYKYVDYIEIQPEITDTYPFVADGNINRKIIHSQSEALSSPFKYDMQVKSTLGAGTHTFNFTLRYRLKGSTGAEPDKTETCMLFVSEPAQPTVDPQAGYVRFAQMPNANAKVGESLTLDLGVEFASSDGQRFSYTDPEFYRYVDYIEIQPEITDNYPFVVTDELSRKIIRSLEDAQTNPFTYGVQVKKSLTNGAYTFNFTLRYRLKGKAEPEADKTEAGMVFVTGAKTSTGGGGGGGGGGVSLPDPQAKLIVDSLSTDPSVPQAGDTFDVKLMLKNTNEKQYIQNIKVSYTVDNDVLLPANGSSSFYIPKINAGETYELVIPVTARPDMPDSPVKMNLTMEYEDKKVSSVSANQVVILNVKQVQKIKLDQLVLPQGEVLVGESASFTMNIINSGRTTLYNVSAAMLDNDMFTTGGSSYIGNLEAGASKQMELDIYPNAEGAIDGTVRVTYEDANGNQQYEDVPYSIYASPVDDGSDDINNPIIEPTPEPTYEISNILENLPWWVYGAAGLFVICIVMLLAVAAHRRKAASMMDYDDD